MLTSILTPRSTLKSILMAISILMEKSILMRINILMEKKMEKSILMARSTHTLTLKRSLASQPLRFNRS
jgi:hypothetical protein